MTEFKPCCDCRISKPVGDFYIQRLARDGRQRRCKTCQKAFMADWYRRNTDEVLAKTTRWKKENPVLRHASNALYRGAHPYKCATGTLWHKAKKLNAIPRWANRTAIEALYKRAQELTDTTGVRHQVDHIVPLASPIVCGLHVEHNLQVLTLKENRAKSNKHWPDMPEVTNV